MTKKCCPVTCVATYLLAVGGLNWGLVGAFDFDLVQFLFTQTLGVPMLSNIVYIVVGLSALVVLASKLGLMGGSCSKNSCSKK